MRVRTDLDLLSAWRDGDAQAADALIRRHFDAVFRFFRSKVHGEVEDLIQQTFLACAESHHRFQEKSSFRVFLLGIAYHQLLSHIRKEQRGRKVFDPAASSVEDVVESPSGILIQRDQEALVYRALRRIPLDLQITLELYYWEEFKTAQIAAVFDVPAGTIKSRLSRARLRVREEIEKLAATPELARSTVEGLDAWARGLRDAWKPPSTPG